MEKVVFIIHSNHYSPQLLNHYVERNTDCKAFNFFQADEVLLYLNLRPNVIIYGRDEYTFDSGFLQKLNEKGNKTRFMGIHEDFIRIDVLSDQGQMILEDIHPYRDLYRDLHNMCTYEVKVS